ncbi:MAG: DUF3899 domain-containing protein [Clostridia bacterium]|nr:DUF3899 domain-containing protein [Clostridia bacterium]
MNQDNKPDTTNNPQHDIATQEQKKIDISNQMEDIKGKHDKIWLIYLITAVVGLMIVFLACLIGDIFSPANDGREYVIIMDGFTVAGALLMGVGAMGWIANQGGFDMLGFGFKQLIRIFNPASKLEKKRQTFYEYKEEKSKKSVRVGHTLLVGLGYLVVAIIMFIIYKLV